MARIKRIDLLKPTRVIERRRIDRRKLGELMSPWGSDFSYGKGSGAVGAVSSFYYSDHVYPHAEIVDDALQEILRLIPMAEGEMHGWTLKDARQLRSIASGLRYYLHRDYQ